MLEIMRKVILGLMVWNLFLTAGVLINFTQKIPGEKLNQQICMLEEIPMEELR